MLSKDWLNFEFLKSQAKTTGEGVSKSSLITVYIVLHVMKEMREQLGLEATLEYARKYMEKLEQNNPQIKRHVCKVLADMDVEKMYKEALL